MTCWEKKKKLQLFQRYFNLIQDTVHGNDHLCITVSLFIEKIYTRQICDVLHYHFCHKFIFLQKKTKASVREITRNNNNLTGFTKIILQWRMFKGLPKLK